jgi:hypothetical protein
MINKIKHIVVAAAILFTSHAHAFFSPLSVGILPPIQFPPSDFSITGARISLLWGHHRDIYGLDLGVLGNVTDQEFTGIGIAGITNITHGTTKAIGLQLAGVANVNTNKTSVYGAQVALGLNYNTASSSVAGLELALINLAPNTDIYGLQLGLYNKALSVYGFQIGLVNVTSSLHGVQIGLINFNHTGFFTVSPFLNVGF